MIKDLRMLRNTLEEDGASSKWIHGRLIALLERETRKRLALEEALRQYLKNVGPNPFSAAHTLLNFLEADERKEGLID